MPSPFKELWIPEGMNLSFNPDKVAEDTHVMTNKRFSSKEFGYSLGNLWLPDIDSFCFSAVDLLKIMTFIPVPQYQIFRSIYPATCHALNQLISKWFLIHYPTEAAALIEESAKINKADEAISLHKMAIQKSIDLDKKNRRITGVDGTGTSY